MSILMSLCDSLIESLFSLPIITDGDIIRESLDPTLFPGISSSIGVHSGFAGSQARLVGRSSRPENIEAHIMMLTAIRRSAPDVLAAVKTGLTQFGTNKVTVTGHSLGKRFA